jgi:hypothetical protein
MKTFSVIIFVILSLAGCGRGYSVDPQLEPLVQAFRDASRAHGNPQDVTSLEMKFVPAGSLRAKSEYATGYCQGGTIEIDERAFKYSSKEQQELVVFHELGHCVLGRSHKNEMSQGMPTSVMHPNIADYYQVWDAKREELLRELFTN